MKKVQPLRDKDLNQYEPPKQASGSILKFGAASSSSKENDNVNTKQPIITPKKRRMDTDATDEDSSPIRGFGQSFHSCTTPSSSTTTPNNPRSRNSSAKKVSLENASPSSSVLLTSLAERLLELRGVEEATARSLQPDSDSDANANDVLSAVMESLESLSTARTSGNDPKSSFVNRSSAARPKEAGLFTDAAGEDEIQGPVPLDAMDSGSFHQAVLKTKASAMKHLLRYLDVGDDFLPVGPVTSIEVQLQKYRHLNATYSEAHTLSDDKDLLEILTNPSRPLGDQSRAFGGREASSLIVPLPELSLLQLQLGRWRERYGKSDDEKENSCNSAAPTAAAPVVIASAPNAAAPDADPDAAPLREGITEAGADHCP